MKRNFESKNISGQEETDEETWDDEDAQLDLSDAEPES